MHAGISNIILSHTHMFISLDYIVWIGKGLINLLVYTPTYEIDKASLMYPIHGFIYLPFNLKSERGIEADVWGTLSISGLGFPAPT